MLCQRLAVDSERSPANVAAMLRALIAPASSVRDGARDIVRAVREGGDRVLADYVSRLDPPSSQPLRVGAAELAAAEAQLPEDLRAGLEVARSNVQTLARAGLGDVETLTLAQGQRIELRELPVSSAAIYVPGGRAPYPSTVVMGAVTARVAGVERIVVCAPGAHRSILGACALCGVEEVYGMGGAHAVAALAYGTETIERVDVIAGPGNLWVQEAKREVSTDVGIDGFLGPSDLLVIATDDADPELAALDLLAQAEHGEGTLVAALSPDPEWLDAVQARMLEAGPVDGGAVCALVAVPSAGAALATAEAFAPEHLQLVGPEAEALSGRVARAGCLFVGRESGTAFGDYVAGSNHSLPTGGSARFASALSPRQFRRRMAEVRIGPAAGALARAGVPIAEAEGFTAHARSMQARATVRENP